MEELYQKLIESIGEDTTRAGLVDTPKRAAKALLDLTEGYRLSLDSIINNAIFETTSQQIVLVKDIELFSMCEHHLLPFHGVCHIAYIPNGKVLGLSKLARIVDLYAKRLQIQEELTQQVASCIESVIDAAAVCVIIKAKHMCMMMRGVEKQNSTMTTSVMLGGFLNDPRSRMEVLELINA